MTPSSLSPLRRPAWVGHLPLLLGAFAASYAATVAAGTVKRLGEGAALDTSLLATLPIDSEFVLLSRPSRSDRWGSTPSAFIRCSNC